MKIDQDIENGLRHLKDPKRRAMIRRSANLLQVPDWPEEMWSIPNEIARSALFCVRNRHCRRNYHECEPIATIGNDIIITYRGQELRQDDRDVWLHLLYLARQQSIAIKDIGSPTILFVPSQFCAKIGWHKNSFYYDKLEDVIGRLGATEVKIKSLRIGRTIGFSLIRKTIIRKNHNKGRLSKWQVWMEPEIVQLLDNNYNTWVKTQLNIGLSPLAKWLQAYYCSHKDPYPVMVSTIMHGCGSASKSIKNFLRNLRRALDCLKDTGVLVDWEIKDQKVTVWRGNR